MGSFDIDEDYLNFFGIQLVEGTLPTPTLKYVDGYLRTFYDSDKKEKPYLLNQTAVNELGWQDPIGKRCSRCNKGFPCTRPTP